MALFNLLAKLSLDGSSFEAGLKRADSAANKFGASLKRNMAGFLTAAFSTAAISRATSELKRFVNEVDDLSDKLGITNEKAQELLALSAKFGVPVDKFASSIDKLGEARRKALEDADPKALSAFQHFGIDVNATNQKGFTDAMLAERLGKAIHGRNLSSQDRSMFGDLVGEKGKGVMAALAELGDPNFKPAAAANIQTINSLIDGMEKFVLDLKTFGVDYLAPLIRKAQESSGTDSAPIQQKIMRELAKFGFNPMMTGNAIVIAGIKEALRNSKGAAETLAKVADVTGQPFDTTPLYTRKPGDPTKETAIPALKVDPFSAFQNSPGNANIGGFFFGADAALRSIPQQQLQETKSMRKSIEAIERVVTSEEPL
jgi:hypothetical protein